MLENIKRLCAERGISLSELERLSGLSRNTVGKWDENRPSVDKAKAVADCLGVPLDELLRNTKVE